MHYTFSSPALPGAAQLNLRPEATTVMLANDHVLSFDGEGRLITAYRGGHLFKRGLDQRVLEKWRPWAIGRPEHIRRDLAEDEKRRLVGDVLATLGQVLGALPADAPPAARARPGTRTRPRSCACR